MSHKYWDARVEREMGGYQNPPIRFTSQLPEEARRCRMARGKSSGHKDPCHTRKESWPGSFPPVVTVVDYTYRIHYRHSWGSRRHRVAHRCRNPIHHNRSSYPLDRQADPRGRNLR